jgi:hypothetical protein
MEFIFKDSCGVGFIAGIKVNEILTSVMDME